MLFRSETIWEAFSFPEPADGQNKEIIALLRASESVSLHVRRGDYVGFDGKLICLINLESATDTTSTKGLS